MSHCNILPKKGQDLFIKLQKEFGRKTAVEIFNRVKTMPFIQKYGNLLEFNEEVPTFESLMKLPIVRNYIGLKTLADNLNKKLIRYEDNSANVSMLINLAEQFNLSPENKDLVSYVDYDANGKIYMKVSPRSKEATEIALSQLKILKMAEKAAELLAPANITIEELTEIEKAAGRVGVTEFKHMEDALNLFTVVVRLANNLEGYGALSEEIAHILVGVNKDNPFVRRSIAYLSKEENARKVLGDEYDNVYNFYKGNTELIAEEAAGHLLKQALLNKMLGLESNHPAVVNRMSESILKTFEDIDAVNYEDSIRAIVLGYEALAEEYLTGKRKITKESIQTAKRVATFNALSERALKLLDILREFNIEEYKHSVLLVGKTHLVGAPTSKEVILKGAKKMEKVLALIDETGETMKAVATVVDTAKESLDVVVKQLQNLDKIPLQEAFGVLRNALTACTLYKGLIDKLNTILTTEYLTDTDIQNQNFMLDDLADTLKDFRGDPVTTLDTSSMSTEEIAETIHKEGEDLTLSEDGTHYVDAHGRKSMRVTSAITATKGAKEFDPNSPYITPSTNIGTGFDELVRDFFNKKIVKKNKVWQINDKKLSEVYPNANEDSLQRFVESLSILLKEFQKEGITIIARDIKVLGTIDTVDGLGNKHSVRVAGTIDLLGYNSKGEWFVFDMKTHRGAIDTNHKEHWQKQLSLYATFLEKRYGINVVKTSIIPIKVSYPKPLGAKGGTVTYTVSKEEKPEDYNGTQNNQLLIDGLEFKGASPYRELTISLQRKDVEFEYKKIADDPTDGLEKGIVGIKELIRTLLSMIQEAEILFNDKSTPYFLKFLKEFIGDEITVPDPENKGKFKKVSIEEVLKAANTEVTWVQEYLTTMADNPDPLLQMYDKIIKDKKHEKRFKVIEYSQRILALGMKFEKLGITDYTFMFEEGKEEYINPFYSKTAYNKALKEFNEYLQNKYGTTVIGTVEHTKKQLEKTQWLKDNHKLVNVRGQYRNIPNPELYPSTYSSLSENQKELYDAWIEIKEELDELLLGKTSVLNTIKIRKDGFERLLGMASLEAISNMVEGIKSTFLKSFDDETLYAKGIRDLEGNERRVLPVMYLSLNGGNATDISTDIISTLIAYADMACNYEAMNSIVNPLEIGKLIIRKNRKIYKQHKGKSLKEVFSTGSGTAEALVTVNTESSKFYETLNNLLDSKLYGIHQTEASEILGMDSNKVVSTVTSLASYAQMGFNFLANLTNALNGVVQMNTEALAGQYFEASHLRKADSQYAEEIPEVLGDVGCRVLHSKLELISEKLNLRLNFQKTIRHKSFKNRWLLTRIFGPSFAFVGQESTDHWLYHRAALAYLDKHYQFKLGDSTIRFWDIWEKELIDPDNESAGYRIKLREGVTNMDGSEITNKDLIKMSNEVSEMNKLLFGVYNPEDRIELRRTAWGKLIMHYRDWAPTAYRRRFGVASGRLEAGADAKREGFYRTTGRFVLHLLQDLKRGELNISREWNKLDDYERANVVRAIGETAQLAALWIIFMLLKAPDLKDRTWLRRILATLTRRGITEVGAMNPLGLVPEGLKILKSPFGASTVVEDIWNLTHLLNPVNYFDEIESGDFKGHSTAYKYFMRSPLFGPYENINKTINPEKSLQWYDR